MDWIVSGVGDAKTVEITYSINWNMSNSNGARVSNGIYFVRIQTKAGVQSTTITVK
ncbi:MAG: hypothetical protein H0V61_00630 [Chitinophagales bacterium]|nr:hypothetical protein [Chitinophagales bacterium]